MKPKLKTLKDCYMSDSRNYEQNLKEEAIKWIKAIDSGNLLYISIDNRKKIPMFWDRNLADNPIEYSRDLINWIKHFFDITEEDLK